MEVCEEVGPRADWEEDFIMFDGLWADALSVMGTGGAIDGRKLGGELAGKSDAEQKVILAKKSAEREELNKKIADVAKKRDAYLKDTLEQVVEVLEASVSEFSGTLANVKEQLKLLNGEEKFVPENIVAWLHERRKL
jgi:hypothetical protein